MVSEEGCVWILVILSSFKKRPFLALSLHRLKLIRVLFFCFLVGLIYGMFVVCLNSNEISSSCKTIVQNFLSVRLSQSFWLTCFFSFLTYFVPVALIFALGFVPFLQFVFFLIPVFYGLGFGVIISYLIVFRGFEGLFIVLVEVFPCALISVLVLILSCKEGFRFSNKIFKKLFLKHNYLSYKLEFKTYFFKFVTLLSFQLAASVLDGFCNFVFLKI